MIDLSGRTALVTGANQGLGWGIAQLFAPQDARVVVNYPDQARYLSRTQSLNDTQVAQSEICNRRPRPSPRMRRAPAASSSGCVPRPR
jgi:NAD(P)-dependent dehydrogenase (short-subunit alcohol dehydrogenase family)